ncbi:protein translocase subunit SecF [Pseudotabrizicola alkalilacus]|uniref:Protein-export membrane protein SecF n=1 Tax=Pseudotabrizicola alkalilacus TaxID=2305252 RepID=A0A411YZ51_9RHOB|nr:protein translocase subunit SecF [Pseudotabrizicola alkalilacus]RGP36084.1 protein translocase subunit SecF [Pseudotabrizicola alkalilacus]
MAFRLRLAPEHTNINFFAYQWAMLVTSCVMILASIALWAVMGLNFGIDFQGGTTIRTESNQPVDVAAYRQAMTGLELGDVAITEVFDPTFDADQFVAQVRIAAQDGSEAVTPETIQLVEDALKTVDPSITFPSVESVGPKVSGELIWSAILAVVGASGAILIYIWLRFEWQYAVGAVAALVHDIIITIGVFALFQIKFDLAIVAALLTILGYSINDTVVIFDRLRENLVKYKTMPLRDVMNLSANETLSRTLMTTGTTLIALIAMLIFGGDVIRGFVFAITFGIVIGTYSSVYIAKNLVLMIGLDRTDKPKKGAPDEYADIDA